jgi:photosystem II stability/assembly factor-like uncharacterized protein
LPPVRIEQVGPNDANASLSIAETDQWVSGKALSVALSADGQRAYLGGHSGVWRSDDGGATWTHSERPQPALGQPVSGALTSPNVYDLAISPANNDIVFAATGDDARSPDRSGVYRSTDGAQTWTLVAPAPKTGNLFLVSQFAQAPDNAQLIYAAAGSFILFSSTGGDQWMQITPSPFNAGDRVWHVATGRIAGAERWVYAVGTRVWFSRDGGQSWSQDMVAASHNLTLGPTRFGASDGARSLTVNPTDPHIVFLTRTDFSIWNGNYFDLPLTQVWTQLASTPVIPNGPTDSGANFIVSHVTPDNQWFLISSDRRTVCIAPNLPTGTSQWTRIEDGHCHVDPHSLALTPDFFPAIASGSPSSRGRAILVNDAGAVFTTDGGRSWSHGRGIRTLNAANFAVAPRGANAQPTLFFGGGDNAGFSSDNGGQNWSTQDYDGGDNDCSFADPMQPTRAIVFAPRQEGPKQIFREIFLYISGGSGPPSVAWGTGDRHQIPGPPPSPTSSKDAGWNAVSSFVNFGFRPLVLTIAGQEAPLPGGDVIIVRFTPNAAFLMRTWKLADISSADDWVSTATADGPNVKSFQVGPQLPVNDSGAVQASGGHSSTVFYFSDPVHFDFDEVNNPGGMRLWKWTAGLPEWELIVPPQVLAHPVGIGTGGAGGINRGPQNARRFYVDPYRPNLIYVLADDHVYRSDDGGAGWAVDTALETQLTQGGAFSCVVSQDDNPAEALLRDMQFDPLRPGTRFAAGPAGVFATFDGETWAPLVVSEAIALRPTGITYDFRSCPRALYVSTFNSGILRLSPFPPDWDFPLNSLQATTGLITLLRVNEVGTGYGPPDDFLDAEVIVWLDSEPEKAFGFQLRNGGSLPDAQGELKTLRDAFNANRRVRLEFIRTGCRTGQIVRVIQQH